MRVALVNTNRIRPPIAPIGLDYVADALGSAGHDVDILDLCWADDWESSIVRFFGGRSVGLVGVTLRNTDDCAFSSRQSFLPEFADIVAAIRTETEAPVVVGGVGFSTMPEAALDSCGADAGIWGDGEFAAVDLADRIERNGAWDDVPGLVLRRDGEWRRNPPSHRALEGLPDMGRTRVDNVRYFREGGQIGFETKRGCTGRCVYCADPTAKGKAVRLRPPGAAADELERLLGQGITHFHTCDSEFNLPERHAIDVCAEFERRELGGRVNWYAYCSARPFSAELARSMRRAGCVGINFGVDSGDAEMLRRLGRDTTPDDILGVARACREAGIVVMLDLLLGSPGETRESIVRTVELMKRAGPDRVGVAIGVRVYPNTAIGQAVASGELADGILGGDDPLEPMFYVDPGVASNMVELLDDLIGDDRRFFFFDPSRPDRNYNYNANQVLSDAIAGGYRGAYWDILRRCSRS